MLSGLCRRDNPNQCNKVQRLIEPVFVPSNYDYHNDLFINNDAQEQIIERKACLTRTMIS